MWVRGVARGALVAITAFLSAAAHANEAAHEMAEKLVGEARGVLVNPKAAPSRASDAHAAEAADAAVKREAERESLAARKEAARKKAQAARTGEAKRRAAAEAAQAAERRGDETDMLARARLEAEQMRAAAEEARLTEEARRLIIEAERERAKTEELLRGDAEAPATPIATKPQHADSSEAVRQFLERAQETRRMLEKLKRVRQIHATRLAARANRARRDAEVGSAGLGRPPAPLTSPVGARDAPGAVATAQPAPSAFSAGVTATPPLDKSEQAASEERTSPHIATAPPPSLATPPIRALEKTRSVGADLNRVTVLLIMVPGSYGIRRGGVQVADPVLCMRDGCYISAGADRPATFLPGRRALGLRNTWGARAGACRNALGCTFRSVELGTLPAFLQPVDLHIFRHDLRAGFAVLADSDCAITAGRLTCRYGIDAETYTMWIVPERLAEMLGPAGLERALSEGLNGPRSALFAPR